MIVFTLKIKDQDLYFLCDSFVPFFFSFVNNKLLYAKIAVFFVGDEMSAFKKKFLSKKLFFDKMSFGDSWKKKECCCTEQS